MTRAVSVVIERSPGGGGGVWMQVDRERLWKVCSPFVALGWVQRHLERMGAHQAERARVLNLLVKEMNWKRRAEVCAEVPA